MNTANIITICIIILIAAVAFACFIGRFTSKRTCCGTEKVRPNRKKLKDAEGVMTFRVEGMHCNNCKASIENRINGMDGLAAKADIEKKTVTVSYSRGIKADPERIVEILGELGFIAEEK